MKLIGSNKGFDIYFNCNSQCYTVFKDNRMLITDKYRYRDVKSYLD